MSWLISRTKSIINHTKLTILRIKTRENNGVSYTATVALICIALHRHTGIAHSLDLTCISTLSVTRVFRFYYTVYTCTRPKNRACTRKKKITFETGLIHCMYVFTVFTFSIAKWRTMTDTKCVQNSIHCTRIFSIVKWRTMTDTKSLFWLIRMGSWRTPRSQIWLTNFVKWRTPGSHIWLTKLGNDAPMPGVVGWDLTLTSA